MTRRTCLTAACAVAALLVWSQKAPAQVIYGGYVNPAAPYYYSTPYYGYYAPAYVGGAYYRPYGALYGRAGYVGGRYVGGRYWGGAYGARYGYGVRAGYRVGGFRRW
jgi:hypothetical protein